MFIGIDCWLLLVVLYYIKKNIENSVKNIDLKK